MLNQKVKFHHILIEKHHKAVVQSNLHLTWPHIFREARVACNEKMCSTSDLWHRFVCWVKPVLNTTCIANHLDLETIYIHANACCMKSVWLFFHGPPFDMFNLQTSLMKLFMSSVNCIFSHLYSLKCIWQHHIHRQYSGWSMTPKLVAEFRNASLLMLSNPHVYVNSQSTALVLCLCLNVVL